RALAERLRVPPRDLAGKMCHEVLDGCAAPPANCSHACGMASGQRQASELELPHLGGVFESVTEPIYAANGSTTEIASWVHRLRDVTEQRRLEADARHFTERLETEVRQRTRELASANVALERAS